MDPALFCEVTFDDDQIESDNLTEDDIVLLDNDYEETVNHGSKRLLNGNNASTPPAKKARRSTPKVTNKYMQDTKFKPAKNPHSPPQVGMSA